MSSLMMTSDAFFAAPGASRREEFLQGRELREHRLAVALEVVRLGVELRRENLSRHRS